MERTVTLESEELGLVFSCINYLFDCKWHRISLYVSASRCGFESSEKLTIHAGVL